MAITVKNFAALTVFIQYRISSGNVLDQNDIDHLMYLVQNMQEPVSTPAIGVDLVPLFNALYEGKKIEAIKAHRMITGFGLKESKDEIERLINGVVKQYPQGQ